MKFGKRIIESNPISRPNLVIFLLLFTALPLLSSQDLWADPLPVPGTGQTQCYTYDFNSDTWSEAACPQPGEDYYGQDGSYLINPPSYTKLDASGNDLPSDAASWVMVRDNVTGLIVKVCHVHMRRDMYDRC